MFVKVMYVRQSPLICVVHPDIDTIPTPKRFGVTVFSLMPRLEATPYSTSRAFAYASGGWKIVSLKKAMVCSFQVMALSSTTLHHRLLSGTAVFASDGLAT